MRAPELCMSMQVNLAISCKAMLPILCTGHVRVRLWGEPNGGKSGRILRKLSHALVEQPSGIVHLDLYSRGPWASTRQLLDLRYMIPRTLACMVLNQACKRPQDQCYHQHISTGTNTLPLCGCSLLSRLRKISMSGVSISLPALQPVATRLQELHLRISRLQGSADGFLTQGWTALTSLCLTHCHVRDQLLPALKLSALKDLDIHGFAHRGGVLRPKQDLCCPQLSCLTFYLDSSFRHYGCSFSSLSQLSRLRVIDCFRQASPASMELGLPASLTHLTIGAQHRNGLDADDLDLTWVAAEAAKCVGRGAQLHTLVCKFAQPCLQPVALWGATLAEQHTRLGGQLSSLKELEVRGSGEPLLQAVGALAGAVPSLTRLVFELRTPLRHTMELPPICSASLESVTVELSLWGSEDLVLTFLPGCARLREVLVRYGYTPPAKGTTVKICCHCSSQDFVWPLCVFAESAKPWTVPSDTWADVKGVGIEWLPLPPSRVQGCRVLFESHGFNYLSEQQPMWGHFVMPGVS